MYPEFRKKINDKFVMAAKCTLNCGGPARGGTIGHVPRMAAMCITLRLRGAA